MSRPAAALAVATMVATVLGACVAGPGASSVPSGSVAPPPTGASASPTVPGIALPGNPDTIVIQVRDEGGFVAPDYRFTALPRLTVYGDGRVVQPGAQIAIYPAPLLPAVLLGQVSSAQLQVLLGAAEAAGLRSGAGASYPPHGIADAPNTTFLVWRPEGLTRTSFGALGMEQTGIDAAEAAARAAASTFLATLTSLQVPSSTSYVPTAARIVVRPYANPSPELPQAAVAWPLAAGLASAGTPVVDGSPESGRCLVVTGADLAAVWPLFQRANALTPFRDGGSDYALLVRPLLPGEAESCPAT